MIKQNFLMIGYPYTYGDSSEEGVDSPKFDRKIFGRSIAVLAITLVPKLSKASENATVPVLLAQAIVPNKAPTAIGPVSAVCCAGAGYCAHMAQMKAKNGDMKASTAAACGALTFCCAQRAAQAYNL